MGLSQQKLADLCNLEKSQINRIELGKVNTGIRHIATIVEVFKLRPMQSLDVEVKKGER